MPIEELTRDESGRLLAADGYPRGGLASVREVCAATGLSRSCVYQMIANTEIPVKRFGTAVRIPWAVVRHELLQLREQD